jgi:hypothetical protein
MIVIATDGRADVACCDTPVTGHPIRTPALSRGREAHRDTLIIFVPIRCVVDDLVDSMVTEAA